MFDLTDRCALVTGASRGIGFAVARALGKQGAAVVLTGRKAETLHAAVGQLRSEGIDARPEVCHQGDPAAIAALFDRLATPPDIAIINAATNPVYGLLLDLELSAWQKLVEVNLTGALLTAQQAGRRMVSKRRGAIVFMASTVGLEPAPGLGGYSVSKAGLLGLMRALARELGPHGVRVNAIAPGLIETRFAAALLNNPRVHDEFVKKTALGRHGQPTDVAGVVVFLASDAAAYVTGQTLIVDGGGRM